MVQLERHIVFPMVYRIIELALLLPVATATVERAFSAMKIIKTELRNKITDAWLNDLMCATLKEKYTKDWILNKLKRPSKARKIDKCNCLSLVDLDVDATRGIFLLHLLNIP
jgi:hypothetical protein